MDQATQSEPKATTTRVTDSEAQRAFNWAIVISGIRCLIAYILLPFVIPIIGITEGVGPWLGIAIGLVAIVSNIYSIRRFSRSTHRLRKPVIAINYLVIGLLLVLLAVDISAVVNGPI